MNSQELIGYFENLRNEHEKKDFKDRVKTGVLFFLFLEVILLVGYCNIVPDTLIEILNNKDGVHKFSLLFGTGLIAFLSFFMFFITTRSIVSRYYNDNGNEDINLYDAFSFIYEKERKSKSQSEFKDFIDMKYEKDMLSELMKIKTNDKSLFDKQKNDIKRIYANKEKLVTRGDVLQKYFYQKFYHSYL